MQRRFFLTATASLLVASGFLSTPAFAATRVIDTDLVIVGGGLSGIAAAAEATDKGLKPVVKLTVANRYNAQYVESPVRRIERGSLSA